MRGQVRQFSISEAILKNSFTPYIGRKIMCELVYMIYFDSCCVDNKNIAICRRLKYCVIFFLLFELSLGILPSFL